MPRIRGLVDTPQSTIGGSLVERLADELSHDRDTGQPLIYETAFPTGKLRVSVIWDEWDSIDLEERTDVIYRAYGKAEEKRVP